MILPGPGARVALVDDQRLATRPWYQFFMSFRGAVSLLLADNITPGSTLLSSTGVPLNGNGADGDYCFRTDGTAGAHIYFKTAGAWVAIA